MIQVHFYVHFKSTLSSVQTRRTGRPPTAEANYNIGRQCAAALYTPTKLTCKKCGALNQISFLGERQQKQTVIKAAVGAEFSKTCGGSSNLRSSSDLFVASVVRKWETDTSKIKFLQKGGREGEGAWESMSEGFIGQPEFRENHGWADQHCTSPPFYFLLLFFKDS